MNSSEPTQVVDRRSAALLIGATIVFTLTFAVHSGALRNEFLNYDDNFYITENFHLGEFTLDTILWFFSHAYYNSYIPLTMVSHMVDYRLWGLSPLGHHLTNLLLHSMNAVWVMIIGFLLYRNLAGTERDERSWLTGPIVGAACGALLFALHPARTESVGWVSDRKDLLSAFFLLPSMAAYLQYASGTVGRKWYWVSFALLGCAVLSKTTAVMAPLAMILIDVLLFSRRPIVRLVVEKIPMLLVSAAAGFMAEHLLVRSALHAFVSDASALQRSLLPAYAVIFYPLQLLWPAGLRPLYVLPAPWTMVAGACIAAAVLVSAAVAIRRLRGWAVAWGVYLLFLTPTMLGLSAAIQPLADRYSYIPTVSLFLLMGWGLAVLFEQWRSGRRKVPWIAAGSFTAVILIVFGGMSMTQMQYWQTSAGLWSRQVEVQPVGFAYNNLGNALLNEGDIDGAIGAFLQASQTGPDYVQSFNNLGSAYVMKGSSRAREAFEQAIAHDSGNVDAYLSLANVLRSEGKDAEAREACEQAIMNARRIVSASPGSTDAGYQLGCAYYFIGDTTRAFQSFVNVLTMDPNYAAAYFNIGVIHGNRHDDGLSLKAFRAAARLGSKNAQRILSERGYGW